MTAQRASGTRDVPGFDFITPQPEPEQVEVPKRADQGPRPTISHEVMQVGEYPRRLPLNLDLERPDDRVSSVQPFKFPRLPSPTARFQTLRVWEGVVVGMGTMKFKAVLTDIEDSRFGRESGEFYFTEVSEADRSLVQLGAVFYWYVGIKISRSRNLTEVSGLRFRRLPAWSSQQVKAVEDEAQRLDRLFGNEGSEGNTSSSAES